MEVETPRKFKTIISRYVIIIFYYLESEVAFFLVKKRVTFRQTNESYIDNSMDIRQAYEFFLFLKESLRTKRKDTKKLR